MCLVTIAFQMVPDRPLIVAANRDEFYSRPSAPSHWWKEAAPILAGRDLVKGGTWMGTAKNGRFCALTNYRNPAELTEGKASRGEIVPAFLRSGQDTETFLEELAKKKNRYPGFNLVAGTKDELFAYESHSGKRPFKLLPGIHSVSNAFINTPWPKTIKAKQKMAAYLQNEEKLFEMLSDREIANDDQLPKTGLDLDWEQLLSPVFIESKEYGTRSSTVFIIKKNGTAKWIERSFHIGQFKEEQQFSFWTN